MNGLLAADTLTLDLPLAVSLKPALAPFALARGGAALKDVFTESHQREQLRREREQARVRQAQAVAAWRPRYDLD